MLLREFGEIRQGAVLIVPCMGKINEDGSEHCCGKIRIPFKPPLPGFKPVKPNADNKYWTRERGQSLDDLTLSQSIDAGDCGHFMITDGKILKLPNK